jgi:hypothetical protein
MKSILFLFLLISLGAFSQVEREIPLLCNQELFPVEGDMTLLKKNIGTFDSTFIYSTDTLSFPFFDDFSKNKFQKYNAQFSDPGVTQIKKYSLLDLANVPLSVNAVYSLNPTYHRYVNSVSGSYTDTLFPVVNVNIGSLFSYPVIYNNAPVYPPYIIIDTIDMANPADTIFVSENTVKQDSATQFFKQLNDPNSLWLDSRAYHNYRFAVEPWTIGVVTFDGINDKGYPYSFGATTSDYADVLTTKPIDLSLNGVGDSVSLLFLYQKQGFGEEPEAEDSLTLQFYNPVTNAWKRVWGVKGGSTSDFRPVRIPLSNPDYFNTGFQMRWRNFGSLAGGLDHFHLDYVKLDQSIFVNDTLFEDFAFSYPTGSLLKDYTSVPWDHYKNNFSGKMNDKTEIVVRNGSNSPENNLDGSLVISYNGVTEGVPYVLPAQTLSGGNINYAPRTTYYSLHDFTTGYHFDETKLGTKQVFDIKTTATAQFTDFTGNDTTYTRQYFANYYSYDDGTAERAYSFNVPQGRLAVRFTPYEADSVIGALINFVPAVVNAENELFILTLWDDNNGVPGNVLYEDNLFFPKQPIYETTNNKFVPYYFDDTARVSVNGTFYIGFRQFDPEPLNIGLDKNLDNSSNNFYSFNAGASWNQSSISGSLLMRPIFSTSLNAELRLEEKVPFVDEFVLYPNPTKQLVTLKSKNNRPILGMSLYNLQGQLVKEAIGNQMDLSNLQSGIYLVKPNGTDQIIKLIKE